MVTKTNQKAFFFLRHNNDIDHMIPVIYKWASNENVPTDVIVTTSKDLLDDYRVKLLKKFKNVNLFYINDWYKSHTLTHLFFNKYFKYISESDKLIKKYRLVKRIANKAIKRFTKKLFKDVESAIVCFDWTDTYFVQQVLKAAKQKGFTTVSLPHGDRPYASRLELNEDLNYDVLTTYKTSDIFDYIVVPNKLVSERYEPFLDINRIKILGSPRYSDEWMNIIEKHIPEFDIKGSKNKLKIVFFLRNTGYPIFWDEVVRTFKLILQFDEIFLVVKHHPRATNAKKITNDLLANYSDVRDKVGKNLHFDFGKIKSESILKWADIVIDIGTSVTWSTVKQKKPVLMIEYLYANHSVIAYYMKSSEIKCRDDLYKTLESFLKNKNQKFYNEKERKKFIEDVIDYPDKKVLERYVRFLRKCLDEST